jgi:MoaA/NifB/PqqE/SkfB family radical SAM enzyme
MSKPSVELWLELETRCNLACKFCYNYWKDGSASEPERRSSHETISALRTLFESVQCTQIAFSGGEPLLRSDLMELILLAHSYAIPAILTTNGVLLTTDRICDLISAGVETFQIPLHSHLENVHDDLSGGRSWRSSLAAMIRVRESGSSLAPVFVATNRNIGHFPHVVRMLNHIGVSRIIFNRFIPTGLGALFREQIGVPADEDLIQILTEADQVARGRGIRIHLGTPVQVSRRRFSNWTNVELASCPVQVGQQRWTISADLNIRRCNQSAANIGNLLGDGIDRLLAELRVPARNDAGEVRSCRILAQEPLVQIRGV